MDVFVLDSFYRRNFFVEKYESMIWTERVSTYGDFELHIPSTPENRSLLTKGTNLGINKSRRVMEVETIEDTEDEDGKKMLKVTGSSIEKLMMFRTAWPTIGGTTNNTTDNPKWLLSGTPGYLMRYLFDYIIRNHTLDANDAMPVLHTGSVYAVGTIAEPTDSIDIELDPTNVYAAIKQLADAYNAGFRLYRDMDNANLYFDVYFGSDRTSQQTTLDTVIFSKDLENLQNVSELNSDANYINVINIISPIGSKKVIRDGADSEVGLDRKVLTINNTDLQYPDRTTVISAAQTASINVATNLSTTTQDRKDALAKMGQMKRLTSAEVTLITAVSVDSGLTTAQKADIVAARNVNTGYNTTEDTWREAQLLALATAELNKPENNTIRALDGEVPQNEDAYVYEIKYFLGDLVEMRNEDGISNLMRVTEQIFVDDTEGDRAYPTLTSSVFITPGTWLDSQYNIDWDDADSLIPGPYWADQPADS